MFDTQLFNRYSLSYDSKLSELLRKASSSILVLGQQDALSSINTRLRPEMATAYGTWLKEQGVPLTSSDLFAHDQALAAGMYLRHGICLAQVGKGEFAYVTQSSTFLIALLKLQCPNKKDAIRQEFVPSLAEIRDGKMPVAVLGRNQGGFYVKDSMMLTSQSLLSVVPYQLFEAYALGLVDQLLRQPLIVSYRQAGQPVKAVVGLAPPQLRRFFEFSTLDEARNVVINRLIASESLAMLPVIDMRKGSELRLIPILSLIKLIPTS